MGRRSANTIDARRGSIPLPSITDELIAMIMQLSPSDQRVLKNIVLGYLEYKVTGETAALGTAFAALCVLLDDKDHSDRG